MWLLSVQRVKKRTLSYKVIGPDLPTLPHQEGVTLILSYSSSHPHSLHSHLISDSWLMINIVRVSLFSLMWSVLEQC